MQLTGWCLHDQFKIIERAVATACNRNFAFPVRPEIGKHRAHRIIAPAVAAKRLKGRRDILDAERNAKLFRNQFAAPQAVGRRVCFGQHQSIHLRGAERANSERGADRAIDAAGDRDDHAASTQLAAHNLKHSLCDAIRFGFAVQRENIRVQRWRAHCVGCVDVVSTSCLQQRRACVQHSRQY